MIVVVGAGLAGLAAAARLAARGHVVTVLEAAASPGGVTTAVRNGRYAFDAGSTMLTLPAVYRDLFLQTGAPLEDSIDIIDIDDAFRYEFAGGQSVRLPGSGVGRTAQALAEAFGSQAGQQWRDFMAAAGAMWAVARLTFLESEMPSSARLPPRLRPSPVGRWPRRTLRSMTSHFLRDPRLQLIAEFPCVMSGNDPRSAPAMLATIGYIQQTFGVQHVAGGVHRLATALIERCERLGVRFEYDSPVTAIVGTQAVAGVEVRGSELVSCQAVIWAADCSDDTVTSSRTWSQLVVMQALDRPTFGLAHHNIWFTDDTNAELDALRSGRLFDSPTVYVCDPHDDLMRPPASASWRIAAPVARHDPHQGVDWDSAAQAYATHVVDQLATRGHDTRPHAIWQGLLSPADYGRMSGSGDGAVGGPAYNGIASAFARPQRGQLAGVYYVGTGAHPGPGIPLAGMGARTVAGMVPVSQVP